MPTIILEDIHATLAELIEQLPPVKMLPFSATASQSPP